MEIGPIIRSLTRNRARFVLIALEVALTLAIVTNCLALISKARTEMARQSGFDDENLLWVRSRNFAPDFEEPAYRKDVAALDRETLRHLPGVRAVANTAFLPWQGGGSSGEVKIANSDREKVRTQTYRADPDLADTLDMKVIAGRAFTWEEYHSREGGETALNVLISQALGDLLFPGGDALGKVLADPQETATYTVVGILDDFYNPYGWPIHEYVIFFPGPTAFSAGSSFLVRTEPGQVPVVRREIERALLAKNHGRTVQVRSIPEVRAVFDMGNDVLVKVLGAVMVLLVLVTGIGIVGLTSFSVTERRRQIGTRRALGATKEAILRYFLLENWLVTTLGLVVGVALAVALNVGLVHVADGAKLSPWLLLGGVVLLWIIGLGATLGPAIRAANLPPAIATRNV